MASSFCYLANGWQFHFHFSFSASRNPRPQQSIKMVLTDKQRGDLHAGIYTYFLSRGPEFAGCAEALAQVDPDSCTSANANDDENKSSATSPRASSSSATPVLEKKWTAVPRLQRRVLELERQIAANAKIHAHRHSTGGVAEGSGTAGMQGRERRMLPRPPATHTLQSHSGVVTTVSIHPIFTMAASGSEDGTVKLWDYESGEYIRTLRGHTNVVTCVDFSPKGGYLVSTSTDLSIKIWDVSEYKCVRTLRGHDHTISAVRFVPPAIGALYLERSEGNMPGAEAAAGGSRGGGASGVDPFVAGSKFLVTASRDRTVKVSYGLLFDLMVTCCCVFCTFYELLTLYSICSFGTSKPAFAIIHYRTMGIGYVASPSVLQPPVGEVRARAARRRQEEREIICNPSH